MFEDEAEEAYLCPAFRTRCCPEVSTQGKGGLTGEGRRPAPGGRRALVGPSSFHCLQVGTPESSPAAMHRQTEGSTEPGRGMALGVPLKKNVWAYRRVLRKQ